MIVTQRRTYETTHPWITFEIDWDAAPRSIWRKLGQVAANCVRISEVPLPPGLASHFRSISVSKGARATAAIEGNTLSEEEVRERIELHDEDDDDIPESKEEQFQEIDNIIDVYSEVANHVAKHGVTDITVDEVLEYNAKILKDLDLEEDVNPGEFRTGPVSVFTYTGVPVEDCQYLLQRLLGWINKPQWVSDFDPLSNGILRAIIGHLYFEWIHPFRDGNGRVGRLLELRILLSSGAPDVAAHLLTNHYNETRVQYYRQLNRASRSGGDIFPFVEYALTGFLDALNEEFKAIHGQHLSIAWRDYVYELFKDKKSGVDERRRKVVLDLSQKDEPVPLQKIKDLSPRVAELYANKTTMTIRRDMRELQRLSLVTFERAGWRARKEIMSSFLPTRVDPEQ